MTERNRAVLEAIEYHLPEARVTNDALAEQFPDWTPARIHEMVGIDERHVAADDECASDLAVAAATKLFASGRASPADIEQLRSTLGLDRPLLVQYVTFLKGLAVGDLGTSLRTNQPVAAAIAERMPATVELAAAAMTLAIVWAIPLGILAAVSAGTRIDMAATTLALVGISMPNFWLGPILAIERFGELEEALGRIDQLPFALTAGLFSRDPVVIEHVAAAVPAGNLYVNRATTGAMASTQPRPRSACPQQPAAAAQPQRRGN